MYRCIGSHFHDWIDYHGIAVSIELLKRGPHIFCFLGAFLRLANIPECLHCR